MRTPRRNISEQPLKEKKWLAGASGRDNSIRSMKPMHCTCALALLGLVAFLAACAKSQSPGSSSTGSSGPRKPAAQWTALFPEDGVPKGWRVTEWSDLAKPAPAGVQWTVKDGVLHGSPQRGTWLVSEKEYGDFKIEYDFKLGPRGNSGLALRAPMRGDPAFDGLELQMADFRYNEQAKDSELTGGLYRALAPSKQVYKPEEWNRYRVELRGSRLKVTLNGEVIQDTDLSAHALPVKRHDGTMAPPLKDRPRRGHIGFQELSRGGDQVMIRNARIQVLD
jgi:hypothetical protein